MKVVLCHAETFQPRNHHSVNSMGAAIFLIQIFTLILRFTLELNVTYVSLLT